MNIKFGQYIEATAWTADKLHFTENKWLLMTEKKNSLQQHEDDVSSYYFKTDQS